MNLKVIGLVGPHGAGKTTVAKHLVEKFGFRRFHLGLSVKEAVLWGFGLHRDQVDGGLIDLETADLGGVTPRAVLEAVGDAVHRVAPQATSIAWERAVRALPPENGRVLADGIRRVAEAEAVRRLDGIVIRISRPNTFDPNLPCDVTQAEVQEDEVLYNIGDPSHVLRKAEELVGYLISEDHP
jgi:hypothetical protein